MSTNKKPRADAKLKTLPAERQSAIAEFASQPGNTLAKTVTWLREDGIETSTGALSVFLSWHSLQRQLSRNESTVETLLEELKKSKPDLSQEELDRAGQMFFTALSIEQKDSLGWQRAQNVKIKQGALALESRRIALLEKKAAAFDRAQKILDEAKSSKGGVTAETFRKIESELKLFPK